ncbi:MAG: hypothetical protein RLZZ517_245 [Candidatus Parcubacteria bacterium]|jgi:hypothetical protein
MTLLELAVMIITLSSFIAILFVGARAFRLSQIPIECQANQKLFETELRKYRSCKDLKPGDLLNPDNVLIHGGINPEEFKCSEGGTYTFLPQIPPTGTAIKCSKHPQ